MPRRDTLGPNACLVKETWAQMPAAFELAELQVP